jgi:hypothetical protein
MRCCGCHVSAQHETKKRRQRSSLFQRSGEPASRGRTQRAAHGACIWARSTINNKQTGASVCRCLTRSKEAIPVAITGIGLISRLGFMRGITNKRSRARALRPSVAARLVKLFSGINTPEARAIAHSGVSLQTLNAIISQKAECGFPNQEWGLTMDRFVGLRHPPIS